MSKNYLDYFNTISLSIFFVAAGIMFFQRVFNDKAPTPHFHFAIIISVLILFFLLILIALYFNTINKSKILVNPFLFFAHHIICLLMVFSSAGLFYIYDIFAEGNLDAPRFMIICGLLSFVVLASITISFVKCQKA